MKLDDKVLIKGTFQGTSKDRYGNVRAMVTIGDSTYLAPIDQVKPAEQEPIQISAQVPMFVVPVPGTADWYYTQGKYNGAPVPGELDVLDVEPQYIPKDMLWTEEQIKGHGLVNYLRIPIDLD